MCFVYVDVSNELNGCCLRSTKLFHSWRVPAAFLPSKSRHYTSGAPLTSVLCIHFYSHSTSKEWSLVVEWSGLLTWMTSRIDVVVGNICYLRQSIMNFVGFRFLRQIVHKLYVIKLFHWLGLPQYCLMEAAVKHFDCMAGIQGNSMFDL